MMTRKPFLIVLPFVIALIAVLVLLLALGGVAVAQEPEQTGNHSVRSLVNHGPQPGILEDNISTRASTEENAMAETEAAQSPFGGVLQVSALGDLEVCPVSRLEAAFSGIPQKGGQPLAFSYYQGSVHVFPSFIGDDPTHCQHYQGMARKDVEGTPYLFFTRSGNETVSCPGKGYWPGELLIVRMGSKSNVNGESLGSNCVSLDNGKCEPADGDRTQKSIHFNPWTEPAPGGITHPGWMHLGGVQLVGDVLVVPVEKRCDCFRDNGQCGVYEDNECKKPDSDDGALVLYDVSDPENPQLLKEIRTYGGYPWPTFPGIGVVAATKNPWGNNYLFMVGGADFDGEKKYWFLESNTDDLKNPNLMLTRIGVWNSDEVGRGACQEDPWMKWQMLNFVRDTTGTLYLIGTDNSTDLPGGDDWVRLFRVERVGNEFTLTCKGERHLYSDESTHHDDGV